MTAGDGNETFSLIFQDCLFNCPFTPSNIFCRALNKSRVETVSIILIFHSVEKVFIDNL